MVPPVETVCGPGQVVTTELPAVQVNVTVTLELFQPLPSGAGETEAVMEGGAAVAVTVRFADFAIAPKVAVIVVLPVAIPVARPFALTEAMPVFAELQVTDAVTSCVLPSV